jgi:predicted lipase
MGILVFRGTQPFKLLDYLTDANAQPSPGQSKGFETVHGGFYRNTMEVWDDICEVLEHAHETGMETLFITGHSLGGAMAVIAGALVLENPVLAETLLGIYTFGQPAVGGADFAMHANDIGMHMLYRHVYKRDIIPLFPPRILGDFFHFGAEIAYKKDRWEPEPWATAPLLIGVFELLIGAAAWVGKQMVITEWIANRLPYSIADHLPENYLRGWSK